MGYTENARSTLDGIVQYIEGDGLAQYVEKNLFIRAKGLDIPATHWTSLNRLAVLSQGGNMDCRGFNQWNKAGRKVKKGARCVFILGPMLATKKDDDGNPETTPEGETKQKLIGFKCIPVFPSEQTEGDPLPYEKEGFDLTKLPLKSVADHLGIKVHSGLTADAYGFFRPKTKDIVLGTDDMTTWLHELSHGIDNEIEGKSEDYDFNEIVAELSSATLCKILGLPGHIEHTKAYIEGYKGKAHVAHSMAAAVARVGRIFEYIADIDKSFAAQPV